MNSTRWSVERLQSLRSLGDPPADRVIAALFADGSVGAVNNLLRGLVANDEIVPDQFPAVVRDYLNGTAGLPVWSDPEKIHTGEDLFCQFGPQSISILFCASLLECYACGRGAQVLYMTHQLTGHLQRRILETAQLVIDVMAPGGLTPGGRGIRSAQKVRLMHAAIRHLAPLSADWKPEFGLPINQEDLAGTLMTFSVIVIDGLKKLNISLTAEQEEAYLHTWKNVGVFLGIHEDLLPTDVEDGRDLIRAIQQHQRLPSDAGVQLTRALIDFLDRTLPANGLEGVPVALMWHLTGDEVAAILQIPPPNWTRYLIGPLRFVDGLSERLEHRSALVERLAELLHLTILEALVYVERGGNRPPFRIPPTLCDAWGVSDEARKITLSGQATA